MSEQADNELLVTWGVAGRVFAGESESGDLHIVHRSANRVLMGVLDGLGHGQAAAAAARHAESVINTFSHEPLVSLFERCHERLRTTRGAAMTLVAFDRDAGVMQWMGVGNVKAVLFRAHPGAHPPLTDLLIRAGIVGSHPLPLLRSSEVRVSRGDTLVIATDGLNHAFLDDVTNNESPQNLADRLLEKHQLRTDDSLVLVIRYLGEADG